jgi:hypothetical protein
MSVFEFVECEYSELLRRVPTRWLSLEKAVELLLQHFEAISSYFKSSSECPPFVNNECVVKEELLRIYLAFFNNASRMS